MNAQHQARWDRPRDMRPILRHSRAMVSHAFHDAGPRGALFALAQQSINLAQYVVSGALIDETMSQTLAELANTFLVPTFSHDAVEQAILTGPRFYANLAAAEVRRPVTGEVGVLETPRGIYIDHTSDSGGSNGIVGGPYEDHESAAFAARVFAVEHGCHTAC